MLARFQNNDSISTSQHGIVHLCHLLNMCSSLSLTDGESSNKRHRLFEMIIKSFKVSCEKCDFDLVLERNGVHLLRHSMLSYDVSFVLYPRFNV